MINIRCIALLTFCFMSTGVSAACLQDSERFRGQQVIALPAQSAVLVRIQPWGEALFIDMMSDSVSAQEPETGRKASVRYAHPGGTNLEHQILLESSNQADEVTICLMARFAKGNPGSPQVNVTQLPFNGNDATSLFELNRYRELTEAAAFWGENTATSRAKALAIYQQHAAATPSALAAIKTHAAVFEALALMRRSSYSEALTRWQAMRLLPGLNAVYRYKIQWKIGQTLLRLGRHDEALDALKSAVAIIQSHAADVGDSNQTAGDLTEIQLAMAESYLAQGDRSQAQIQIARAEGHAATDYRLMGRLYDILGYLAIVNSQQPGLSLAQQHEALGEAVDVMLTGRFFSETSGDSITQAAFENNLGFAYDQLGEYHRAFQHYRQILDMVTAEEDPLVYRYAYSNLGKLYQYTADYARSASYYRQAIALSESSSGLSSTTRCALGTTLRLNDELMAALSEHEQCLQAAERINRPSALALARLELGEDYLALGDSERAWAYVRQAWEQGNDGIPPAIRARVQRRYVWFLQQQGRSAEADAQLEALLSEPGNRALVRVDQIDNLAMAMEVASAQANVEQAIDYGLQAIQLIEQQYEQLESARLGATWSDRAHAVYVALSELYLQRYFNGYQTAYLTDAFNLVERSRAISLRQQFAIQAARKGSAGNSALSGTAPGTSAERAQITKISQIANTHALSASVDAEDVHLPVSYYQHQDLLSLYRLQDMPQLPLPDALDKTAIQARLAPEQSVLYYLAGQEHLYVFNLTASELQVQRLANINEVESLVASVRERLSSPNDSPYSLLAELSSRLLPNNNIMTQSREIMVVPHGSLHALPFSALPLPGNSSYLPLGAHVAVSTIPSLTAWLMEKPDLQHRDQTDIAIFADPVFNAEQLQQDLAYRDISQTRTLSWTDSLERLAATAIEAENITRQFPSEKAVLLTGSAATRRQLARNDVRQASVLHIATHGYFNEASEENVGLGFSVIDDNGQPDSGFVTLPELFSYEFNNQLVVISGCDTSMGRRLAGEGMMGISRGFVAQGAKHVIATLWPVSDQASADFMSVFYEELLASRHVAQALQAAQQAFINNPRYRNPYYWAAYTLTSVSPDPFIDFSLSNLSD